MDCASDLHNNPIRQLETSSHTVGQEKVLENFSNLSSFAEQEVDFRDCSFR